MISAAFCRTMTRYNQWQNASLMTSATNLTQEDRWLDRGAFFGSIARTFNHLLRDDALWMARLDGDPHPEMRLNTSIDHPTDWAQFRAERVALDRQLIDWAANLQPPDMTHDVRWQPGGGPAQMQRPWWQCAAHLFNHQTHHRGQIHAMLTAAGQAPEATDLPMLKVERNRDVEHVTRPEKSG